MDGDKEMRYPTDLACAQWKNINGHFLGCVPVNGRSGIGKCDSILKKNWLPTALTVACVSTIYYVSMTLHVFWQNADKNEKICCVINPQKLGALRLA